MAVAWGGESPAPIWADPSITTVACECVVWIFANPISRMQPFHRAQKDKRLSWNKMLRSTLSRSSTLVLPSRERGSRSNGGERTSDVRTRVAQENWSLPPTSAADTSATWRFWFDATATLVTAQC